MRAATVVDGEVRFAGHADPQPGTGEVLVAVRAAGLNGADLHQLAGRYPAPPGFPQDILGMELAGEVIARGPETFRFDNGDRVMAIVGGGAQAELAVVNERMLMPVPERLDWPAAGGLPEAFVTAHDAIFTQGQLCAGERLLVHGAAGGVGSAAVQLGLATGARVTATVRNRAHRPAIAALGAAAIAPEGFGEHGPFDVVLELVGASNMRENLAALDVGGRICVIGLGGGATAELNLGALMAKRGRIHGSTLRSRSLEEKATATRLLERQVLPLFDSGHLDVLVDATFPLADAAAAYEHFAVGGKLGKVVLVSG